MPKTTLKSQTRLLEYANRSEVSCERPCFYSVESKDAEPQVTHFPRCFRRVTLTAAPWDDPVTELGVPIDR